MKKYEVIVLVEDEDNDRKLHEVVARNKDDAREKAKEYFRFLGWTVRSAASVTEL